MNHWMHPFIAQPFATGGPHADVHPGAMYGLEIDHQNGGDMWNTYTMGLGTDSPVEAALETSASNVPVDGSMGIIGVQVM